MEQTGLFLDNGHIMKKITTTLLTLLLLFTFFAIPARISADQTNTQQDEQVVEESVDYDLPFSGMLPDSPFYIIKKARDHVHIFFTRDHIKKSELLLQVADKKIVMAQELAEKEKWDLVVETIKDSQTDTEQMIPSMETGQKIGTSASPELISLAQTSNEKHEEIMKQLLGNAPETNQEDIKDCIRQNVKNFNRLEQL